MGRTRNGNVNRWYKPSRSMVYWEAVGPCRRGTNGLPPRGEVRTDKWASTSGCPFCSASQQTHSNRLHKNLAGLRCHYGSIGQISYIVRILNSVEKTTSESYIEGSNFLEITDLMSSCLEEERDCKNKTAPG